MSANREAMAKQGKIRVGIGGWTFEPWRGAFYPKGLPHARELEYASEHLTTIEINGTFYRTQTPATFAKWAKETPDGFVFSVKGPRYAVNRRVLAEAGDSDQAVLRIRACWSWATSSARCCGSSRRPRSSTPPTSARSSSCCRAKLDGRKLRHVVEVRHDSFCVPEFIALVRKFATPVVFAEHAQLSGDRRSGRRLRLRAAAEGRRQHPHRLSAEAARRLGQARRRLWAKGGAPEGSAARRSGQDGQDSAARRVRLLHPRGARCARPPPPWR